jgi:hypothetical protein
MWMPSITDVTYVVRPSTESGELHLAWAISDILTVPNLAVAMVAGFVGYVVFEFLRKKLP